MMLARAKFSLVAAVGALWIACQGDIHAAAPADVQVSKQGLSAAIQMPPATHHMTCGTPAMQSAPAAAAPKLAHRPAAGEVSIMALGAPKKTDGNQRTAPRPVSATVGARYRAYEAELADRAAAPGAVVQTAEARAAAAVALKAQMIPESTGHEVSP